MRKKGKCIFAHGPVELRVKESRRGKWGARYQEGIEECSSSESSVVDYRTSGGEDVLGAARSIEKIRAAEGSISDYEKSAKKNIKYYK
jgi:hypothetical protein